jgi:hypothetical protein
MELMMDDKKRRMEVTMADRRGGKGEKNVQSN